MLITALPILADDRAVKRQLVSELIELLDVKALMQASFDALTAGMQSTPADEVPEEYREEYEARLKAENERLRLFRERLFTRVDHTKLVDEVYAPLIDERFTIDELRELIAFFKTRTGQRMAGLLPELGIGSMVKGMSFLAEAAETTREELAREEAAKNPWKATLNDMRTIATAVEARATDTDEYPQVAFEELESLIAPTYIRSVPKTDSWGTPFLYVCNGEHYRLVSAGADKRFEWSSRQLDLNATRPKFSESLDADIVLQDGSFLQSPKEKNEP